MSQEPNKTTKINLQPEGLEPTRASFRPTTIQQSTQLQLGGPCNSGSVSPRYPTQLLRKSHRLRTTTYGTGSTATKQNGSQHPERLLEDWLTLMSLHHQRKSRQSPVAALQVPLLTTASKTIQDTLDTRPLSDSSTESLTLWLDPSGLGAVTTVSETKSRPSRRSLGSSFSDLPATTPRASGSSGQSSSLKNCLRRLSLMAQAAMAVENTKKRRKNLLCCFTCGLSKGQQ